MERKNRIKPFIHIPVICAVLLSGMMTCSSTPENRSHEMLEIYSLSDRDLKNPLGNTDAIVVHTLKGYTEYFIVKAGVSAREIPLLLDADEVKVELFEIAMVTFGRKSVPDELVPVNNKDFVLRDHSAFYLIGLTSVQNSAENEVSISAGPDYPDSRISIKIVTGSTSFDDIKNNIPRNAFSTYVPTFLREKTAAEKADAYRKITERLIGELGFSPKYPPDIFWESDEYRDWYLSNVTSVSVKKKDIGKAIEYGLGSGDPFYCRIIDEPKSRDDLAEIEEVRSFYNLEGFPVKQLVAFNHRFVAFRDVFRAVHDDVDIWCMNLRLLNSKGVRDKLDKLRAEGKQIWLYVCCDDGRDMNVHLTAELVESRAIFWYMWLNEIDGFLYWSVNRWMNRDVIHDPRPGTDKRRYGDGILIYPDPKDDSSFLMSLRAINIKAGMMEYAVLSSLDESGRKRLKAEVSGIIESPRKFSSNPAVYDKLIQTAKTLLP